jgi:hypothetical protein
MHPFEILPKKHWPTGILAKIWATPPPPPPVVSTVCIFASVTSEEFHKLVKLFLVTFTWKTKTFENLFSIADNQSFLT